MNKKDRAIFIWLLTGAFLVLSMVVLGGYTRLSHSGLSMVKWKPLTGFIPPMSEADWQEEFEHYKSSPEFIKKNSEYTLAEFKKIFWPEFLHRVLGRLIGLVFIIPFIFFWAKGYLKDRKLRRQLFGIFLLGGLQGFIGWYMVKSGLVDNPNVSHYRLAIHLSTALLLYSVILWVAFNIRQRRASSQLISTSSGRSLLTILIVFCLQLIYGAFVAGLKAGKFYNKWPKMDDNFLTGSAWGTLDRMGLSALFESPVWVQFIHRWLGALVVLMIFIHWFRFKAENKNSLQGAQRILMIVVILQFLLGVFTLLYMAPLNLSLLHQFGAVALLSSILYLMHRMRTVSSSM